MSSSRSLLDPDLEHVLVHTRDLWEKMRGQRLYLTGGTGFFGSWLLETFAHANRELELGAEAVVLTRDAAAFVRKAPHLARDAAVRLVEGDVRSFDVDQLRAQLPALRLPVEFVIHAATEASAALNAALPLLMLETVTEGTRATLGLAQAIGARRFLLTSSGAAYGRQPEGLVRLPETYVGAPDTTAPGSAYGEGKRVAELLCACVPERERMDTLLARCFAFVGPYLPLDTHFAIGNFIRDAMRGEAINVGGDGTPYRSYLYAADLAIWLWTILFRGEARRLYNVGSGDALSIAELAHAVRDAIAPRVPVRIAHPALSGTPALRYVPDVARAETELGLRQYIPLATAIRRTADWHRASARARTRGH